MTPFELGWVGLLLVMISGGFGAVGILPLLGIGLLLNVAAIAVAAF
ncbi:MAG: hypothetical protein ACLFR6_05855 [Salinarchaeum sp.]